MEEKAKVIVEKMIDELNGRGGFDGWWGSIDGDIQDEIKEELEQIVVNNF